MNVSPKFFAQFDFGPVIQLPKTYEIYDFTRGYDPERTRSSVYGIGRYAGKRPGMYEADHFDPKDRRDIHIGIDIAAPVGEPLYAFYEGRIFMAGINDAIGDYGGTLITEHRLEEFTLYALYGHLSHQSVHQAEIGKPIQKGEIIARVGDKTENGGWNSHLHFQLSWLRPEKCDLPGVVSDADLAKALENYPDPRSVLGPLY